MTLKDLKEKIKELEQKEGMNLDDIPLNAGQFTEIEDIDLYTFDYLGGTYIKLEIVLG